MSWIHKPWHDQPEASFRNAFDDLWRAMVCFFLGHHWESVGEFEVEPFVRVCGWCNRKEEWHERRR